MKKRQAMVLPLFLIAAVACKPKLEILPDGAKNISRTDTTEELKSEESTTTVKLREYRFSVNEAKSTQQFICESREFTDEAAARTAAKRSVAERPEEELKSEHGQFARSGRSLWLRAGKNLLWCMYAGNIDSNPASPFQKLKASFMAKFREAA